MKDNLEISATINTEKLTKILSEIQKSIEEVALEKLATKNEQKCKYMLLL